MNKILKINFSRRKKLTGLLGLNLDGSRLEGVVLRRANGSLQLQQSFSATLSLDPLTAAPELVGREIRNHLDAAGVRERRCVVGVPLKWTLTAQTELPLLPAEDAASLLQLEAERGFPCDVNTLRLAHSRCQLPAGKQHVTLVGILNSQLTTLEQVLAAAKLKPVSFSLGITALQPAGNEASNGVMALAMFGPNLPDPDHAFGRIARELHDTTAQGLTALLMNLSLVNESAPELNDKARQLLAGAVALAAWPRAR